jgi:ubiquinol-cytochrome c reductase iron-sulfur subunit
MSTDQSKRRFLTRLTTGVGVVGVGVAVTPFVMSMTPSARARSAGAPVEVDISKLGTGQLLTIEWRGKPVWILRRTPRMLASLDKIEDTVADPVSEISEQPDYVDGRLRSIDQSEVLVVVGICTHLGCSPVKKLEPGVASGLGKDWQGGFFCPCHGSKFDLAGRVYKNVPAPTNLVVPPHNYIKDDLIVVGIDTQKGAA